MPVSTIPEAQSDSIPKSGGASWVGFIGPPETYLHWRIGQGDRHFGIGSKFA
jgi:hypothetical protein